MTLLGNETDVQMSLHEREIHAVRGGNGIWHIEPRELAVSKANAFGHLRDLRAAVRRANVHPARELFTPSRPTR